MQEHMIATNGVTLHNMIDGDEHGEPIIFLHGFPDFWYGWRHQILYFVERGYRVIVPDQRGYNLSDKPPHVHDYRISVLATDIVGLMDALGYDKVHLVGHDWGAAVAWWVATVYPKRLKTLSILNVPYPTIMLKHFQSGNLQQLMKSWYMFFIQIPWLPETLVAQDAFARFGDMIQSSANPGSFSGEDLVKYRQAWAQPNAMKSMMNWYRAMVYPSPKTTTQKPAVNAVRAKVKITVPTLMLWGEKDVALGKELAEPSINLCEDGELVFFPKSSHWIQHDEPNDVSQYIHEFVQSKLGQPIV